MARPHRERTSGELGAAALVILSTLLIAAGQYLLKRGISGELALLILGVALLGIAGLLVAAAFRHGELSALHALFGLGFLWVTLAGVFLLGESIATMQLAGIAAIMAGVVIIGRGA